MRDYKQPPFYHFSRDSIELAHFCAEEVKEKKHLKVLDLAAGCGVVGLEFSFVHGSVQSLDAVELQQDFIPYLEKNFESFFKEDRQIIHKDLKDFRPQREYDIVLCNPPYYLDSESRVSKDLRKQKCHFLSQKSRDLLLEKMNFLSQAGSDVFFLGRDFKKFSEVKKIGKSSIYKIDA